MNNIKSSFVLFLTPFFILLSLPLLAVDCDNPCGDACCDSFWGIRSETRIAYYHPSSKRVRRIYGDGWADYQLELSKSFEKFFGLGKECGLDCLEEMDCRIWTGVSGFSKKGNSIGFHDKTRLQLIPINLGLKIFHPLSCNTKVFIGGAACYSWLRIHDHSDYVHKHVRKGNWGGLFQSGITYDFCHWVYASIFFDYYFQRFHFHDDRIRSGDLNGSSRFVERFDLNMNGYKVGIGLGVRF